MWGGGGHHHTRKGYKMNQATFLKIAAVTIAIPRYAGSFALSAGFVAQGQLHNSLGIAEVVAGTAMAVLEGFALAFILSKWRLLKVGSIAWWSLLLVCFALALSLPLIAVPYLFFMQNGYVSVSQVFSYVWVQNAWNFIVASAPMLVVIGVGLADVNELEREQKAIDFELETSKKKAGLKVELSKLELEVEQAQVLNELEKKRLRAQYKVDASKVEATTRQDTSKPFACPHCNEAYEKQSQLSGHLAHCKAKTNGKQETISIGANTKIKE